MPTFDEKLTAHQSKLEAEHDRDLDNAQEIGDKKEALIEKFHDMLTSVVEEKVSELSDFPYDPDEFIKDVRDMILYMWEDYL